jgi:hypothetical protein
MANDEDDESSPRRWIGRAVDIVLDILDLF